MVSSDSEIPGFPTPPKPTGQVICQMERRWDTNTFANIVKVFTQHVEAGGRRILRVEPGEDGAGKREREDENTARSSLGAGVVIGEGPGGGQ